MKLPDIIANPEQVISQLCEINLDELTSCLKDHAVLYSRAYVYYEQAKASEADNKWQYEKKKSQAFASLREGGLAIGAAQELAGVRPDVVTAYEDYLRASSVCGILWALLKGLEHRKEMLVQLSSREKRDVW